MEGENFHQSEFQRRAEVRASIFRSTHKLVSVIAAYIRTSDMTYKEISRLSGLQYATISKIACGETKSPQIKTAIALGRVLGFNKLEW